MKRISLIALAAIVAGACSSPKYAYHFDHYDYNSGKKNTESVATATNALATEQVSPLVIESPEAMSASAETVTIPATSQKMIPTRQEIAKKIASLSAEERSELKNELKAELKKYKKAKRGDNIDNVTAAKAMDHDLKLAAIFGAVGLVLSLFGGLSPLFYILGVISFVIGVIFLIKWLARQ